MLRIRAESQTITKLIKKRLVKNSRLVQWIGLSFATTCSFIENQTLRSLRVSCHEKKLNKWIIKISARYICTCIILTYTNCAALNQNT